MPSALDARVSDHVRPLGELAEVESHHEEKRAG
jgi:hypothetical protein